VDNDIVLGSVRSFATDDILHDYDVISPIYGRHVFGPFTLYRNTKTVNELFRYTKLSLSTLFASSIVTNFDEWGQENTNEQLQLNYNWTMDGIINEQASRLGIRTYRLSEVIAWDGVCDDTNRRCQECSFNNGVLRTKNGKPRLLCHYQRGKGFLEASLSNNEDTVATILKTGRFRVSHLEGFSLLPHRQTKMSFINSDDDAHGEDEEAIHQEPNFLDFDFVQLSKRELKSILPPHEAGEAYCLQLDENQLITVGGFVDDYSNVTRLLQFLDIKKRSWRSIELPHKVAETHQGVAFDKIHRWLYIVSGQLGGGCLPAVPTVVRIHVV
jgi:hypothetical protein